jgi:hypothetical protein
LTKIRICSHNLTKKAVVFPKPWLEGCDYDLAFHRLKADLLDTNLYLHHKNPEEMLFIEVDASDVGWGACGYICTNVGKEIPVMKLEAE